MECADYECGDYGTIGDNTETIDFEDKEDTDARLTEDIEGTNSRNAAKRGRRNVITWRLASALDNAKVSDGMAMHILTAAAEALGHRVEELALNSSTIHRIRQENRYRESKEIQANFSDNVILTH